MAVAPNFKPRTWVRSRTYLYRFAVHKSEARGEDPLNNSDKILRKRQRRKFFRELGHARELDRLPAHLLGTYSEFW